ncbi:MAG: hypothetical protein IT374_13205 [Polyangiaceae bacterium]|nr:hypothetical protein [Polyangiaceae bacterium]
MRRLIALSLLASGCASIGDPGVVDRRVLGRTTPGRFIGETAYEVSLTAALDDEAGRLEAAEGRYLLLTRLDGQSADAWSRLGSARCRRGVAQAAVDDAFDHAARVEPRYAPAWVRRGRCALSRGDLVAAARSAARAFAAEPTSPDVSELSIEVARRRGDGAEADRLARGLRALSPSVARRDVRRRAGLPEVDTALLRGRDDDARAAAIQAHLSLTALAVRAAALGRLAVARELAALTPDAPDARIVAYAVDEAAAPTTSIDGASPLALALLRDTLRRRGLGDAAALLPAPTSDDALVRALELRR